MRGFSLNLSKTIFLRLEFLERLDNFFSLTLSCSFLILSRWLLILINQFKFTFAPAITSQKLSIKQNNFSQCFSFLIESPDIFFPSHANLHPISSQNFEMSPPRKKFNFHAIKLKALHISRNTMW